MDWHHLRVRRSIGSYRDDSFWHRRAHWQNIEGRFRFSQAMSGLTIRLTPRWSQRRLPLEFMDGLSYTKIIELAESLAGRRGSALDR